MAYVAGDVSVTETNKKNKLRLYVKDGGGVFDMAQSSITTLLSYLGTSGFVKIGYCAAYPTFENAYGDAVEDNEGGESGGQITFTANASQIGLDDATWNSVLCLHETKVTAVYLDPDTGIVRQFKNITMRVYDSSDDAGQEMITYDMYKKASGVAEFSTRNTLIPLAYIGAITGYEIIYAGTGVDIAAAGTTSIEGAGSAGAWTYTADGGVVTIVIGTPGTGYIKDETWGILAPDDVAGVYTTPPIIKFIVDYGC